MPRPFPMPGTHEAEGVDVEGDCLKCILSGYGLSARGLEVGIFLPLVEHKSISSVRLGEVHGAVCTLHQPFRIRGMIRVKCNADTG